jgi:tetratricopeptide (TPR) repeat protein
MSAMVDYVGHLGGVTILTDNQIMQTRAESKTQSVEQINVCLRAGDYSRALDLLRGTAAEFPKDAELSELEKLAQDGAKRNAEASRLITESQELFAQRKSAEAIQLLREAYKLDKNNALARAILANALVEQAHSMVETDWREAETLAKQALELNPAHPTAKTIRSLILERKKASPVEEWVAQAGKLQSAGDLFAALSRVEEGLDIYPNDPKLLQIQDAIQRDQNLRRRQARRRDLENLRRMELEIDGAEDDAGKQVLSDRIQKMAANYWTDGEIISVANGLMQRLGLISQASLAVSSHGAVIFHVPPRSAPKPARTDSGQVPSKVPPNPVAAGNVPGAIARPSVISPSIVSPSKVLTTPPEPQVPSPPADSVPASEPSAPATKAASPSVTSRSHQPKQVTRSNSRTLVLVSVSAAAIVFVAVAAIFFFARPHHAPPVAKAPAAAPSVPGPSTSVPAISGPAASDPTVSAPAVSAPAQTTSEPSLPPSDTAGKAAVEDPPIVDPSPADPPTAESAHNLGTLVVVAGQDDARVFLNGKLQRQRTHSGELRLPNLELKDYVVQVAKGGFQDPPQQKIRIRKGEQTRIIFTLQPQNLQPQPRLASLTIQGGTPGTAVLVDQTVAGTIQPDGTLSVSTVNPGDHIVELRKERFKPRQFKKHFVVGETISLAAADAALEAVPGELKISFAPADARVALVKGDLLTIVNSGVPLNLAGGTYTLTARTADGFTRSSTLEVIAGQSKTLNLSLAPTGMSNWDDPSAWKQEKDSFLRKGGDFVLYRTVPTSGTFVFSAMLTKGRLLQWVLNYTDPKNYVLFQMDDKNFYRTVIHNGEKSDEVIVPDKGDKKSFRTLHVHVSPTEIIHQIRQGDRWIVLDRWSQPGINLSQGKFGFLLPGDDQVAVSSFAHYAVSW